MTDLDGRRVAIVMMSAIGDAVHTLPVINSLRAAAPTVHLTWILQPGPYGLVAGHPAVDEFLLFHRERGLRAFVDLWRQVRTRSFDLVLALQVYFKAGIVVGMLRAPRKIGFDRARARDLNWLFTNERIPARPPQHVLEQYFEFLDYLGVPRRLEWGLEATPEERARYAPLLPPTHAGPTVGFVLATSKPEKDWPAERYAALADRLAADHGARIVLLGGRSPREEAAAAVVRAQARTPVLDLRAQDLRRLVALAERLDVLVSPDTGPMHIGVALGVPTVGLLGYTNPKWGGPVRFRDLMVDAYGDPGEVYPAGRTYRPGRMQRIRVEDVAAKVAEALARYPRRAASA